MSYKHGVYGYENETSLKPSATTGNLVVAIGTAAVNTAKDIKVNEPILCYSMAEYAEYFGSIKI